MTKAKRTQHVTEIHAQFGQLPLYLLAGIPQNAKSSITEEPKQQAQQTQTVRPQPPIPKSSVDRLLVLLHEFSAQYEEARRKGDEW